MNIFQSTPRKRGATLASLSDISLLAFQSTPRKRGATVYVKPIESEVEYFNPRPASAGRQCIYRQCYTK